jgi:hypothetical protein
MWRKAGFAVRQPRDGFSTARMGGRERCRGRLQPGRFRSIPRENNSCRPPDVVGTCSGRLLFRSGFSSMAEPQPNMSCGSEFDVAPFLRAKPALTAVAAATAFRSNHDDCEFVNSQGSQTAQISSLRQPARSIQESSSPKHAGSHRRHEDKRCS